MSLVDYDASSSDEDDDVPIKNPQTTSLNPQPSTRPQSFSEPNQQPQSSKPSPSEKPAMEKLPDAAELLNSAGFSSSGLTGTDRSSLVVAAMAQSALHKRGSAGASLSFPRSAKVPKGALPHSKNVPDTAGRMLVPPQLSGKSNVVTEDITKLFVKKQAEAAKTRVPQFSDS